MLARQHHQDQDAQRRRGIITPVIAIVLLVVVAGVALVLDRLWIDAAALELRVGAEAAALAAGRELAGDDLLRQVIDAENRLAAARAQAGRVAAENLVAGEPLVLETGNGTDVRFGKLVIHAETGITKFLQTDQDPTSVVITAHRTRNRSNPLALFFRGVSGLPSADLVRRAEATIDNRVVGVRPFDGAPVPAAPFAILKSDPGGSRGDTWDVQIEQQTGQDQLGWDSENQRVSQNADGIAEITLHSMRRGGNASEANVQLVDLGTNLQTDALLRQLQRGWTIDDLRRFDSELRLPSTPREFVSSAMIAGRVVTGLEAMIGQVRICLLYTDLVPQGGIGFGTLRGVQLVAGRILSVRVSTDDACEIIIQPAVITTRTALLEYETASSIGKSQAKNQYIYKLQLTH